MTSALRGAVFGFVACFASAAFAGDRSGPYVGVRLVGSVAAVNGAQATGFNGDFVTNSDTDLVGGGGGVFGYRWPKFPFRTELEVAHRVRFDWGVRDSGPPVIGYENNLESTNLLLNILYEYRSESRFTPFIGGTLGWSRNRSAVDRKEISIGTVVQGSTVANNTAWGVMLGADWAFGGNWSAEFAYRYINLGRAVAGPFAAGDGFDADDYSSHDILLSIFYAW